MRELESQDRMGGNWEGVSSGCQKYALARVVRGLLCGIGKARRAKEGSGAERARW